MADTQTHSVTQYLRLLSGGEDNNIFIEMHPLTVEMIQRNYMTQRIFAKVKQCKY